jgi:hypothetical protein
MTTATDYSIRQPSGCAIAWGASPEALQGHLRADAAWPAGRYEVTRHADPASLWRHRWGVAIKHEDGSVGLIPDRPA